MFLIALVAWSLLGGLLYLFVLTMTDSESLALIVAGLTGVVGGCTSAHLLHHRDS